jgi:hypothetical protein
LGLEAKIEELTGAFSALSTLVASQVAIQQRLVAGQAAALEKIDGEKDKVAATTRRSRTPKEEPEAAPAPKAEEPAPTASGAEEAASAAS